MSRDGVKEEKSLQRETLVGRESGGPEAASPPGREQRLQPMDPQDLFDAMDFPVALLGTDCRFQFVNKAYERYLGLPCRDILGRNPAISLGNETYEREIKPRLNACLAGETVSFALWIDYPGVGRRYMDMMYSPMKDGDGGISGVLFISKDATERRHLELESTAIMETAFSGLLVTNRQGRLVETNESASRMLGYTPEELHSLDIWNIDVRESREDALKRLEQLSDMDHARFETRVKCKDGTLLDVEVNARYLGHEDGKVYAFIRDLTPFRMVERELRESHERYKALHDASFGGLCIHDKGLILDCNQGLTDMSGYGRAELIGMDGLRLISRPFRNEVMANILSGTEKPYEVVGRRKDGREFPLRVTARNVPYMGRTVRAVEFRDISEEKRAQQELRESYARLQAVVENMPVMLDAFDESGRLVFWNKECEQVTGYSKADIDEGGDMMALLYPDPEYRREVFRRVEEADGDFFNMEFDLTCKDGSVRTIAWSNVSSRAPIPGWRTWAIGVDITDQKKAQTALEESERKYKSVIDNIQDVFYRTDADAKIILASPSAGILLGYDSVDGIVGKDATSFYVHPEDRENLLAALAEHGSVSDYELTLRRKDGSQVEVSTNSSYYYDESGNVLGVEGVFRDITSKKEAELRIAKSEYKFRSLFDNAGEGIFLSDSEQFITDANHTAARMLGYASPAELIGMNAGELLHPDDFRSLSPKANFIRAQEEGVARSERRYRRKDGTYVPVQITLKLLGDSGLHHVLFSDISERKRFEEALKTKIVALTQPVGDISDLTFESVFDLEDIQRIQDEFSNATGVSSIITRPNGTPLTKPSNFSRMCRDVIRKTPVGLENCKRSDARVGAGLGDGPLVQKCESGGLWNAGASIVVGGKHVANWLIGQIREESQTEDDVRAYAGTIGVDEEELAQAFREVRVMSLAQFEAVAQALHTLVDQISVLAYQNLQQARIIAARDRAEGRNRLLAELLNTSDSIAVYKDTSLRYMMVNNGYLRLTGFGSYEDVLGKTDEQLFADMATPEQIRSYMDNDRAALALPRGEILAAEERLPGPEGDRVFFTKKFPIFEADSEDPIGVATLSSEITEVKRIQDNLAREIEKAEAANRTKTEFLANMSHEIRTPLNGIIGMLQLLQMSVQDQEQKSYTETALLAGSRLTSLLSDILDLSAVEAGKLHLSIGPMHVRDLVESAETLFGMSSAKTNVSFAAKVWPGVPRVVMGDEQRLRQVIFNLVGNGLKFTTAGRVSLEVCHIPYADGSGGNLLFTVADTGPGIPQDQYARAFETFGQISQGLQRTHQGAGLGLPIVKRLVELMHGTICLDSTPGEGTVFYVSIPVGRSERADDIPEASILPDLGAIPEGEGGPARILLVEDEPINSLAMARLLIKRGYGIVTAENGRKALELLRSGSFEAVLMDVQMPEMDGVETTRAIREGEAGNRNRAIPIIAMTALAMDGDREKLLASGMDDYIAKPITFNGLLAVLEKHLDNDR